jgi:subtilisin-like proprotein convertase family protein/streptogramin lyase
MKLLIGCHQFAFVLLLSAVPILAPAQLSSEQAKKDSVVAIVADSQGLPLVPREELPWFGTFWVVRNSLPSIIAPLPCPPLNQDHPIYAISSRQFLVDETDGPLVLLGNRKTTLSSADYALIIEKQVDDLLHHVAWIQEAELSAESLAMGFEGPPLPGGEGGEGNDGGPAFDSPIYGTNDLWLEMLSTSVSNATAELVIHPPWTTTDAVYDLFSATNLVPSWWNWVLRSAPGQTNLTITNLLTPQQFFILGLTNDLDGGGLSDAYEGLLGLDPNDASDDQLTPVVSIQATDSVAIEQQPANTASFLIERLGGNVTWPLTLALQLSGTAILSVNYTLTPADVLTLTSSNLLVTIPAGQTDLVLTLTPMDDHVSDGTKTVTLTLQRSSTWDVNSANSSATAWILEEYTKIYTTVGDFDWGVMSGLDPVLGAGNGQLQFKTNLPPQFPFINVACSERGTVARINTTNGVVIGEYRTAPALLGLLFLPSPSRTTVDQYGNVWVANRADDLFYDGAYHGSITRIGLIVGETRYSKTNGVYVLDPDGEYVDIASASYNTCIDRDGDGFIRTSRGLGNILPWSNSRNGVPHVDSYGGVSTAEDEAISEYLRVPCTGTRTIAVDKFNDIWVGGIGGNQTHLKVNALTGSVVPDSPFSPGAGGYGGVIDSLGTLWSCWVLTGVMRVEPHDNFPPQSYDWQTMTASGTSPYGIAVDPVHPYIWQTSGSSVFRWLTNGAPLTNMFSSTILHPHGGGGSQGLTVDANGHVWVAHGSSSTTVGHLYTNGFLIGVVPLRFAGLRAEFYDNKEMTNDPVFVRADGPIDFDWGAGPPDPIVPTNDFSVKWTGVLQTRVEGDHVFYVSADAGAGFRLTVNSSTLIDNWDNPNPNAVELSATHWFSQNQDYDIALQYKEFTGDACIKLSWTEPGSGKAVIPRSQLKGPDLGDGPTGVSVDSFGKIWAANINSSSAMRIDPNAGPIVLITNFVAGVTDITTNHVGEVDMVVDLGSGAGPYNYSDMTGFNNRVVNPELIPLKGYWTVIHDCGLPGQNWQNVSWNAFLTNGCTVEVFVRAHDSRQILPTQPFVQTFNNAPLSGMRGRYIEVRVGLTRPNTSENPLLYDLTLHGASSAFDGGFLDDAIVLETDDAWFFADISGAEPLTYQWYARYPWTNEFALLTGETHATFVMTDVDAWVDGTRTAVHVSNANGETIWLGPAELWVVPLPITIPAGGSSGAASRYPATINVFGQPTNISTITVTFDFLSHGRPSDLDILLVSPSGKKIMLISNAGGSTAVTNATVVFSANGSLPPESAAIGSHQTHYYRPSNYGDQESQLPGAPAGPYSTDFGDLTGDNPNGQWKLYIYDDASGSGSVGAVQYSWRLEFTFP